MGEEETEYQRDEVPEEVECEGMRKMLNFRGLRLRGVVGANTLPYDLCGWAGGNFGFEGGWRGGSGATCVVACAGACAENNAGEWGEFYGFVAIGAW